MKTAVIDKQILTNKEAANLPYFAEGLTCPEVAERRMRSLSTIRAQASIARQKLGASNITEMVVIALERGILRFLLLIIMIMAGGYKPGNDQATASRMIRVNSARSVRTVRTRRA